MDSNTLTGIIGIVGICIAWYQIRMSRSDNKALEVKNKELAENVSNLLKITNETLKLLKKKRNREIEPGTQLHHKFYSFNLGGMRNKDKSSRSEVIIGKDGLKPYKIDINHDVKHDRCAPKQVISQQVNQISDVLNINKLSYYKQAITELAKAVSSSDELVQALDSDVLDWLRISRQEDDNQHSSEKSPK